MVRALLWSAEASLARAACSLFHKVSVNARCPSASTRKNAPAFPSRLATNGRTDSTDAAHLSITSGVPPHVDVLANIGRSSCRLLDTRLRSGSRTRHPRKVGAELVETEGKIRDMATVIVEGSNVVVKMSDVEKFEAVHTDVHVP